MCATLSPFSPSLQEIRSQAITPADEFIILACDGLWDVLTSQQVQRLCSAYTHSPPPPPSPFTYLTARPSPMCSWPEYLLTFVAPRSLGFDLCRGCMRVTIYVHVSPGDRVMCDCPLPSPTPIHRP